MYCALSNHHNFTVRGDSDMSNILKLLQKITETIHVKHHDRVHRQTLYNDVLRLPLFIGVLSAIAIFLIFFWFQSHESWNVFHHHRYYFWIDVCLLGCMPILALGLYLRWPRSISDINWHHEGLLITFGTLVMIWVALSSGIEQLASGNVAVYIIGLFACATILHFRGLPLLLMYLLSFGLFWVSVINFKSTEVHFFRDYIGLVVLIPLSWICSRVLYVANARNISDQFHISRVNQMLQKEIQERKQVVEALRESEQRLSLHFNQTPLGVIEWDLDFRVTRWNPAAETIFGFKAEEIIGRKADELIPAREIEHVAQIGRDLITQKGGARSSNKNITKDGRIIDCEWYNTPLVAKDGTVIGVASLVLDNTERLQAEKEKQDLEQKLARSQKMEALGLLAGGVAHDLNNVLSGIVSYPDLMLMDMPEDDPVRQRLLIIKDSGQKAATIVQDLLALARRGVSIEEVIDLNDIVTDYFKSPEYSKLIDYHPNIEIAWELETDPPNILGSPVHLKKMVMNLVSNAAEAQPNGGAIIVSTTSQYLDRPVKGYDTIEVGEYAVLRVEDQGTGIAEEDLNRIFEPFYTKKVLGRSGTGLGMAVVWGTVQDLKGYINVQSQSDQGTTFEIFLPLTRREKPGQANAPLIETYRGNQEFILVVDDIESQREIASNILEKLNYKVTAVESGEAAVAYLEDHTVDLIILDMIMDPGIDGLETYKRIILRHPGQKALIASGYAETERVKQTLALGAGSYVKKPYMIDKIGLAVRSELDKAVMKN